MFVLRDGSRTSGESCVGLLLLLGGAMVSLRGSGVCGRSISSAAGFGEVLVEALGLGDSLSSAERGGDDLGG